MATEIGRFRRRKAADKRIDDARALITAALGIALDDPPAVRLSGDPLMKEVLAREALADWLETIAAAVQVPQVEQFAPVKDMPLDDVGGHMMPVPGEATVVEFPAGEQVEEPEPDEPPAKKTKRSRKK